MKMLIVNSLIKNITKILIINIIDFVVIISIINTI